MKHTKGPWSIDRGHIYGSDGHHICEAYYHTPTENERNDIEKANARLIAAAPEMYEAMKEAIRWAQASDEMPSAKIAHITLGLSKILARIEGEVEGV